MKLFDAPTPEETLAKLKLENKKLDRETIRQLFLPRLRKIFVNYLELLQETKEPTD